MFAKPFRPGRKIELRRAAFALAGILFLFWLRRWPKPVEWTPIGANSLASVDLEKALYETGNSHRFLTHFRITNTSRRELALNLRGMGDKWQAFYPYQWTLAEGERAGPVNGLKEIWPHPDFTDQRGHVKRNLLANYKAGKVVTLPPLGTLDYYSESPSGGRVEISNAYGTAPFWMKSKTYLPDAPYPLHFIVSVRGAIAVTDGVTAATFVLQRDLPLRFPLRWKQVPDKARIIRTH